MNYKIIIKSISLVLLVGQMCNNSINPSFIRFYKLFKAAQKLEYGDKDKSLYQILKVKAHCQELCI